MSHLHKNHCVHNNDEYDTVVQCVACVKNEKQYLQPIVHSYFRRLTSLSLLQLTSLAIHERISRNAVNAVYQRQIFLNGTGDSTRKSSVTRVSNFFLDYLIVPVGIRTFLTIKNGV